MKKLITKALFKFFLLGMLFTSVLNFEIQFFRAERSFKELSEGYFSQIGSLLGREADSEQDKVTEIFEMLPPIENTAFYIADADTKQILGATDKDSVGKNSSDIGINLSGVTEKVSGRYNTVKGQRAYCVARRTGNLIFLHTCSRAELLREIAWDTLFLGIYICTIFVFLLAACYRFLDRKIIRSVNHINAQLKEIEGGNYNVTINNADISEFSQLSQTINIMTRGLLGFTKKVSLALELSRVPIGICEYDRERNLFLSTSRVKDIMMFTEEEYQDILSHPKPLETWREEFFCADTDMGTRIYRLKKNKNRYIRLESFSYDKSEMLVLTDVTEEVKEKKSITRERDTDMLTRLYNARAGYRILGELLLKPEIRKKALLFLIDLDHLKFVNDKYGHDGGDRYIEAFAEVMHDCPFLNKVTARMGGDEFFLFTYGYENEEEIKKAIAWMSSVTDAHSVLMENGDEVLLEFSTGYAFCSEEETEIRPLIKRADQRMYEQKKERKSGRDA